MQGLEASLNTETEKLRYIHVGGKNIFKSVFYVSYIAEMKKGVFFEFRYEYTKPHIPCLR